MNSNGTISGAGGGQVTIGGLGYTGALNATNGATIGSNLNGMFTEAEFNARFNTGIISGTYLRNATIGTAQIADLAVSSAKIVNGAITNAKIGNLEVDSAKIANLTIGTQKIEDLSITTATSFYNDYNGAFRFTSYNTWYNIGGGGGSVTYQFVGFGNGDWEFDGFNFYFVGAGTGSYIQVVASSTVAQVSLTPSSSAASGSQKINIEAMVVLARDGGDDDNLDVRVFRQDGTVLSQIYTGIQVHNGRRPYTFFFVDASPIAGTTNTYTLQFRNVPSDGHPFFHDVSLRATLFRK